MNSRELWRKLLFPFRKRQFDRDLEDEMRFHLEMRAAESGAAAARRRFGNVALLREDARRAWGWTAVEEWAADLKYAARALRKNAAFTAVAVITMALGIGASTAVFSVVNAVLLRPLPFGGEDRIVGLFSNWHKPGSERSVVSWQQFEDWAAHAGAFERVAAYVGGGVRTAIDGEPVIIRGGSVTGDFFAALGVRPMWGRAFLPEELRVGGPPAMILSYPFWQRLGGNRAILGTKVQFDRETFTVVGVMPRGFAFPADAEFWKPLTDDGPPKNDGSFSFRAIARLKPGESVARAQIQTETLTRRRYPQWNVGAAVVPIREQIVGDTRPALLVLMGAVGCVLLIACVNIASLLLARVTARRRELALRLSLGAGRWRIARFVLAESLLLALSGAALGVAAAHALVRAFVALDPLQMPRIGEVAVSREVLLCAVGAAVATGLLFGIGPALRASRPHLSADLARGRREMRGLLAAAQVAVAVTLLIGAGLLLRSFLLRVSVPLGFRPEGVLGVELPNYTNRRIHELLDRLNSLPGVQAAAAASAFPQDAAGTSCDSCLEIQGQPVGPPHSIGRMIATPDFFRAAGMTLLRGRFFTAADTPESPKVAILSEALARRDFEGREPIGARVKWGGDWATVVGVVGNVKGFGVAGDPMPAVYFPRGQDDWNNGVQVLVRTSVPPAALASAVRKEIRAWNQRLIITKLDTVENLMAEAVAVPRFYMLLLAGFACLALAISAIGIYGTVNYAVARRTHEIGIRMALGAARRDVLAIVFRHGLGLAAAGLVAGLAGAWLSTRALQSLLFGVRPTDPAAFVYGSIVLLVAVLLACLFPARRATRVDPVEALRQE